MKEKTRNRRGEVGFPPHDQPMAVSRLELRLSDPRLVPHVPPNGWGLKFTSQWEGIEQWTEPFTDRELDVTRQLHPGSWGGSAQTRVISPLGRDGRALPRGQRHSEIRGEGSRETASDKLTRRHKGSVWGPQRNRTDRMSVSCLHLCLSVSTPPSI